MVKKNIYPGFGLCRGHIVAIYIFFFTQIREDSGPGERPPSPLAGALAPPPAVGLRPLGDTREWHAQTRGCDTHRHTGLYG